MTMEVEFASSTMSLSETDGVTCSAICPLEIPVILEEIFKYFHGPHTLRRVRLVNKCWFNASLLQWNSWKTTVAVYPSNSSANQLESRRGNVDAVLKLAQLKNLHASKNFSKFPYRRYEIQSWVIQDNQFQDIDNENGLEEVEDNNELRLQKWIWLDCGYLMKHLTFSECTFSANVTVFKNCFFKAVPNLEKLEIINCDLGRGACMELEKIKGAYFEGENSAKFKHENLKYLHVAKVKSIDGLGELWSPFLKMLPNLTKMSLRRIDKSNHSHCDMTDFLRVYPKVAPNLKSLDILELLGAWKHFKIEKFCDLTCCNLKELRLDVGYDTEKNHITTLIERNGYSLETLVLYRAPFSKPIKDFSLQLFKLSELHLWGNLTDSLMFLKFLPNLRVLIWNSSCYESKGHGERLHSHLRAETFPLCDMDLVENSSKIPDEFRMAHMQKLELDWGPISVQSWKRLGIWMPTIKSLKAMVNRDEQLFFIGKQWTNLESVQLAHGSQITTGRGIVYGLSKLKHLESFLWKGCACTRGNLPDHQKRADIEQTLRGLVGDDGKVILPWDFDSKEEFNTSTVDPIYPICMEAEFRNALCNRSCEKFLQLVRNNTIQN